MFESLTKSGITIVILLKGTRGGCLSRVCVSARSMLALWEGLRLEEASGWSGRGAKRKLDQVKQNFVSHVVPQRIRPGVPQSRPGSGTLGKACGGSVSVFPLGGAGTAVPELMSVFLLSGVGTAVPALV